MRTTVAVLIRFDGSCVEERTGKTYPNVQAAQRAIGTAIRLRRKQPRYSSADKVASQFSYWATGR